MRKILPALIFLTAATFFIIGTTFGGYKATQASNSIYQPKLEWYANETLHYASMAMELEDETTTNTKRIQALEDEVEALKKRNALQAKQLDKPVVKYKSKVKVSKHTKTAKFVISAYSPYDDVSGINADSTPNTTATGTKPKPGTFAVDPKVIPYGSDVTIIYPNGEIETGVAEDTGGAIDNNRIDVFRYKYDTAMKFGMKEAIVLWN